MKQASHKQFQSSSDLARNAPERAVRNCPWSSILWVQRMLYCERLNLPYIDIKSILEKGLAAPLATPGWIAGIFVSLIDYIHVETAFARLILIENMTVIFWVKYGGKAPLLPYHFVSLHWLSLFIHSFLTFYYSLLFFQYYYCQLLNCGLQETIDKLEECKR